MTTLCRGLVKARGMTQSSKRRSRRRPQQWKALLDAFDTRPGTVEAFCETHDVSVSSIGYWRQKLAASATNKRHRSTRNKIVPVQFEAPTLCELATPSGFTLRFPSSIDVATLRDLLGVLEAR